MPHVVIGAITLAAAAALRTQPHTVPLLRRPTARTPAPLAVQTERPEPPTIPTPTEEGGALAKLLPLQLLLESQPADRSNDLLVGEDAGVYDFKRERWGEVALLPSEVTGGAVDAGLGWLQFFVAVGSILSALSVLWIYSPTGYGDDFVAALESLCGGNSHLVTLAFGIIFPVVHSGLASLRPHAEKLVGARAWRVVFASCSLPLAYSWIVYYISHVRARTPRAHRVLRHCRRRLRHLASAARLCVGSPTRRPAPLSTRRCTTASSSGTWSRRRWRTRSRGPSTSPPSSSSIRQSST
jgi:hypothetical protein